jgi:outer membrane protein assembly factor BamD (BamD/ComL family)
MALANRHPDSRRPPTLRRRLGVVLAALAALPGCQSTTGPLAVWRMGRDSSLSKGPTKAELGEDNRSLMARWLSPKKNWHTEDATPSPLVLGSDGWRPMKPVPNPEAEAEFKAAEQLFQQGKFPEAEAAFAKLAKKRKGTEWGEKAQYYLAESLYQRGKYVPAHDAYEKLVADYPGTQYLDKLVSREYAIGLTWLALYDPKAKPEQKIPWTGRFDGRRPPVDTNGHALQALEHVRHHDPTGPLADDAVLRIAQEHEKQGDYEGAAIHYDQLTTDHPKSPYLQGAQLAAIDMRIKGYLGPEYDGSGLEKARELIKQTMATFPDRPAGNEKLYHTLDVINDQEAERTYSEAEYYRRAGYLTSAEYYYSKVRQRWPNSPWATKAKTQLAAIAKMPRKKSWVSKIMTQPGSIDSFNSGQGVAPLGMGPMGPGAGGMGMGGMGMGAPGGMM